MVRRIIVIAGGAAALAILLYTAVLYTGRIAPRSVEAVVPAPCVPGGGVPGGTTNYTLTFTYSTVAGRVADGVCFQFTGTGGTNTLFGAFVDAPACLPANPGAPAAVSAYVWVDWPADCVTQGQTVTVRFRSLAGLTTANIVNWNWHFSVGPGSPGTESESVVPANVTLVGVSAGVGGVSESPDAASLAAAANSGSSTNYMPYVGGGIGAAVLVALVAGGAWYVRRRQRA